MRINNDVHYHHHINYHNNYNLPYHDYDNLLA